MADGIISIEKPRDAPTRPRGENFSLHFFLFFFKVKRKIKTEIVYPGGGADDNVPGGGSQHCCHQTSILLSMNWTTPAVGLMGLLMTTPVVGPSLLRMLIPP
jgi:hypothetical protein